ncbi:uncharacterized protein STEHIDRAFT_123354 [Stereum hirsutum FP-91666 SS1]|uniref:uncharacterized protein n=1 Tax=Stereum hirsutum (strain FP-91666) TaxID=721885 RepID=UPI000444A7F0|nr:uncharacterized protein STEHIDRAFT_123354 [Stereum hirsutum FP-91666 SS1]EIM83737.1 hypothetical protein STEHIDRAFT_123354 [Stereum hirsutum FP-91666 SS1]
MAGLELLDINMSSELEGKLRLHAKKGHIEEARNDSVALVSVDETWTCDVITHVVSSDLV